MDEEKILSYCDQIDALTQKIRDEIDEDEVEFQPIHAGDDLQAAFDAGGAWMIDASVNFENSKGYRANESGMRLRGEGNNLISGGTSAAVTIPMESHDIILEDLTLQATACEVAVQVGTNSSDQNTVELAPVGVEFNRLLVQGHRGKRSFEVNAAHVAFTACDIRDSYDPEGQDSQAISVLNSPGPVSVEGCFLEAASETVMVGGDKMKIPNCRPTGITILKSTLTKKLEWKATGTPKVKNIFELKDGNDVLIEDCDLYYCWKSAQDGYAYMFTPSQGGSLRNVVVRENRVRDVGGIVNITGKDASGINQDRTQVIFEGGEYRTNTAEFPGPGRFALSTGGPESIMVEGCFIRHEGSSFIDHADQSHLDSLRVIGCDWNYGSYGIRIGGYNHGDNTRGLIGTLEVSGCTITGAHSQFKGRYPDNTYVDVMSQEREIEVDKVEGRHRREVEQEVERLWKRLREDSKLSA